MVNEALLSAVGAPWTTVDGRGRPWTGKPALPACVESCGRSRIRPGDTDQKVENSSSSGRADKPNEVHESSLDIIPRPSDDREPLAVSPSGTRRVSVAHSASVQEAVDPCHSSRRTDQRRVLISVGPPITVGVPAEVPRPHLFN